jgi:predicted ATPase
VAAAAKSVSDAASSISTALKLHEESTEELTVQLIATASSAENAWSSYQGRFEQVDEALGKTLEGLVSGVCPAQTVDHKRA